MLENTQPDGFRHWKRRVILFLTGQTVSLFGSSLVQFAIIWYIAKLTNSGVMVTISTLCAFLPQIFISLFAGVWADRYSRKLLIVLADGMIALSTLVLALMMMAGYEGLWMLFLVCAIRSLGSGVQTPAVNALIPQIVPEEQLMRVNGVNGSIQSLVNLVSPAVGGAILTYGSFHSILLIDVVTAAIAISILLPLHIPIHKKAAEQQKPDYFGDIKEGIHYSFNHYFIRTLLGFYAVFTILIVPAAILNVLMVTRVFGNSYWNLTLNEMSFFAGAILGGVLIAAWGGFKNRLVTIAAACCAFGALTFAVGLITSFWVYLGVMVLTGVTVPMFNSPSMVLLQEKVETDMQGRVFSLVQIISMSFMLVGMVVFGPLADVVPIQWLMIGSGALMAVAGLFLLGHKKFLREGLAPQR